MRISVDLPDPLGPRSPYVSPRATSNDTPPSAHSDVAVLRTRRRLRKRLRRSRTTMAGSVIQASSAARTRARACEHTESEALGGEDRGMSQAMGASEASL